MDEEGVERGWRGDDEGVKRGRKEDEKRMKMGRLEKRGLEMVAAWPGRMGKKAGRGDWQNG